MSYLLLKHYFADLVEKSEFLNDFVGYFSRELQNKERSSVGINAPFLALFDYRFGIDGEKSATSVALRNLSFAILLNDVPPDDYEAQYTAIDRAETLAMKVAARLRYDSNRPKHFLYNSFLKNSIEVKPIELDGVGLFGVEVSFQMKNLQSLKLNPEDWNDVEKVCE